MVTQKSKISSIIPVDILMNIILSLNVDPVNDQLSMLSFSIIFK